MSKVIRMTQEYVEECKKEFEQSLANAKLVDGKISFTKTFSAGDRKASVLFTPEAWTKMYLLIQDFSKEVAWHGVAQRSERTDMDEYIITDILVYPQTVSAASVDMDTAKYADWIGENIMDDRFSNIRMQGHSHVNMAPNPSSVDLKHQEDILSMVPDDEFYIFMIYNKSLKRNIKVYDMKQNVLYEDGDITVGLVGDREGLSDFLKGAHDMVKDYTYTSPSTPKTTNSYPSTTGAKPYDPLNSGNKPVVAIGAGWKGVKNQQQSMYDDDYGYGYGYGGGWRN